MNFAESLTLMFQISICEITSNVFPENICISDEDSDQTDTYYITFDLTPILKWALFDLFNFWIHKKSLIQKNQAALLMFFDKEEQNQKSTLTSHFF